MGASPNNIIWPNALCCVTLLGAACVVFATQSSFIAAVSSRFMQLVFGSLEKKVCVIRTLCKGGGGGGLVVIFLPYGSNFSWSNVFVI